MRSTLWLLFVLGCSNDAAKISDAAIDGKRIDAPPPDALLDAPAPPAGTHRYVMDQEMVPTNNNQARAYGLDLNNDNVVDNQFGMIEGTFSGMGVPIQAEATHVIDFGNVITLFDLDAADLTTAATATFTVYTGGNAMPAACNGSNDTTCRHHLAGTATFNVAASSAHDTALPGVIVSNALTAGPGTLHFPVTILGATVWVQLIGARVKLTGFTDPAVMSGIVAGAIPQTELDTKVFPAMTAGLTAQIAADCSALTSPPACGCTNGSLGATALSLFDANNDCTVTTTELQNNSLMLSLFATDVTINNQKALSFGVGVTAVHAAFTP